MRKELLIYALAASMLTITGCGGSGDGGGSIDPTVTSGSVMTSTGFFDVDLYWEQITDTDQYTYFADAYKVLLSATDDSVKYYEYNASSDNFDFELENAYLQASIPLQDGAWATAPVPVHLSTDADDNWVVSDSFGTATYTVTAHDVTGLNIMQTYLTQEEYLETPFSDPATFSEGAKVYEFTSTQTDFQPGYELYYWRGMSCSTDDVCTETEENGNFETYYNPETSSEDFYTSIQQFISDRTQSANKYRLNFFVEADSYSYYVGYFSDDNTIILFNDDNWNEATQAYDDNSQLDVNGSYEIKTVGSTEILVLTLPDIVLESWMRDNSTYIYSIQDGKLREGEYHFAAPSEYLDGYNETAARDIYNVIMAQNSSQPSAAPARSAALSQEVAETKTREREKAFKIQQASRKLNRGFKL
jgi:hypothetical protein